MENNINDLLKKYVIVRAYSAGVFAGTLISKNKREVILHNARRIWGWEGAATLSQLAQSGTSRPNDCKFPEEVDVVLLEEVVEILKVSEKGEASIRNVPIWKS